jgi:enoyl-[acyl-carrier protein] reductase I
MVSGLMEGKRGVVFGVANKRSIAYACAQAAAEQGAKVIVTYQGERLKESVDDLAAALPGGALAVSCDVSSPEAMDAAFEQIREHMPQVDFAVHSIAYAPREELEGDFVNTSQKGFVTTTEISSYSLIAVTKRLAPLMGAGGAIATMTYQGSTHVVPHYNVMGVAKAALEATVRYLAADLGERGIRVNAVSAGPIRTLAAAGIANFNAMLQHARERSPLRRNVEASEVAAATIFLLSDMARAITGEVIFVDGGFHLTAL